MIFGKHINKYYLRYGWALLLGLVTLVIVDYFQLEVPELYGMVINGINDGQVLKDGVMYDFNIDFLLDHVCRPSPEITSTNYNTHLNAIIHQLFYL